MLFYIYFFLPETVFYFCIYRGISIISPLVPAFSIPLSNAPYVLVRRLRPLPVYTERLCVSPPRMYIYAFNV